MRNSLFSLRMRPLYTLRRDELMERLNYSRKIKRRSKLKKGAAVVKGAIQKMHTLWEEYEEEKRSRVEFVCSLPRNWS